jgi:hypothetical protein
LLAELRGLRTAGAAEAQVAGFASLLVGLLVRCLPLDRVELALGDLGFLTGQMVGKSWVTLVAVGLLWFWRRLAPRALAPA